MTSADERTGLEQDRALLDRTSTANRVADILRQRIMEAHFRPGDQLSEEKITTGLGISRNTLREAFRLLTHEKLLVHRLNRGVFVRELNIEDLSDLYRVRRVIECAAVRRAGDIPRNVVERLREAVADAERAAAAGRWPDAGTANLRFHEAIVSLLGSPRIDEMMRRVWAELRLVWHVIDDPRLIFEPYVKPNRKILEHILASDIDGAEKEVYDYLVKAEDQFVTAYSAAAAKR